MASDQRSKLSFVIALSIILGSAGLGRVQRQDAPVNLASTDSQAPPAPGDTPPAHEGEAEED